MYIWIMKKIDTIPDILLEIKKRLSKNKDVLLAYVFGSVVKNPKQAKDIDIAVLLNEEVFRKSGLLDAQIKIEAKLHDLVHQDIDISVLNGAPLILRHQVLKYGRILYEKNEIVRCDFETKSELKFYDFQPYRRLFWKSLAKRIKEGRLGY